MKLYASADAGAFLSKKSDIVLISIQVEKFLKSRSNKLLDAGASQPILPTNLDGPILSIIMVDNSAIDGFLLSNIDLNALIVFDCFVTFHRILYISVYVLPFSVVRTGFLSRKFISLIIDFFHAILFPRPSESK